MSLQDFSTIDLLTACIWAEARGEPIIGKVGVCNVVWNRKIAGGKTIQEIILAPKQFSWTNTSDPNYQSVLDRISGVVPFGLQWRSSATIAQLSFEGCLKDVTGGANHYLNIELTRELRKDGSLPAWVDETKITVKLGNHTFLRL